MPTDLISRRRWMAYATASVASAAARADRPNIILCMADDQGFGDVGFRNHPVLKTPVMDEMAATGLRFERFYTAAPVCSPTRGSVLTGRHPNRYGCFSWGHTLRPRELTIARALKPAGYATGHFGKWHLGPVRADSPVCPGAMGFDEWQSTPNFFENNPLMSRKGKVVETHGEGSQVTVDAALEFIRAATSRRQPFLAVIWFGSPHAPHQALDDDRRLYRDQPEKLQHYYGEITAMDRALGKLREHLRKSGIVENTLLWYNSDNGATPIGSTGGLSGWKGELAEGGLRVPAMIEWPARIPKPRVTHTPCGTVDIFPTLAEIARVPPSRPARPLDGTSLVPLFDGRMERREKPLGFWVYPERGIAAASDKILAELRREQSGEISPSPLPPDPSKITRRYPEDTLPGPAAWIDGDYKLHRPTGALHNLATDPVEKLNLAASDPGRVSRMSAQLEAWQKSVVRSLNGEDYK